MKKLTLVLIIFTTVIFAKLPKKIEFDRLIQKADILTKKGDYFNAHECYKKALKIKIKRPVNFFYNYGYIISRFKIRNNNKEITWSHAQEAFGNYLKKVGEKGEYYKEALNAYNYMESAKDIEHKTCKIKDGKCKDKKIFSLGEIICEMGDGEICYNLAESLDKDKNYNKKMKLYQKACFLKYSKGCNSRYSYSKNKNNNLYLLQKSCELGDIYGCENVKGYNKPNQEVAQ